MVDISIIKKYIIDDNEHFDRCSESSIIDYGFNTWFYNQIRIWINCSYMPTGKRLIQTNDKRYSAEITSMINMIEKFAEDKDKYYTELIKQHNANLEFEAINGFEYDPYSTTKKKSTTSRKKTKQTSLDFGDKPKKETAAEKKLKSHAAKISMLTFKIKPANGN